MTAEGRQVDVAHALEGRAARLGELPSDAADLDDGHTGSVRQHDRHLQDDLQLVADAVGREPRPAETPAGSGEALSGEALEREVWQMLKTCFDPEIPVNIVDLGLIYDLQISTLSGGARVDVKMTLTAQGCGMGTSIAADARNKILDLPGVLEADVLVVWDPPWTPEKISPEGRVLLGIH